MMMSGWISAKAFMMIFGLGTRLRKWTCMPMVISKRNSNIMPYMWAVGSMDTTFMPAFSIGQASLEANSMLEYRARYGIITPLEKPEVPDV